MSRIGRKPIALPTGVTISLGDENHVTVKGPKGTLTRTFNPDMRIAQEDGQLTVTRPSESPLHRSLHGLTRSLLNNMIIGVTSGYRRTLEITGVGYRAVKMGNNLMVLVGFSHPVQVEPPDGITFAMETPTRIAIEGIDKEAVGEIAAKLRGIRPPEPYKGKGISYTGERIRRKAGKAGKAGGKK